MPGHTILDIPAAEQELMLAHLRRARYGHLLALHILLLCAAGWTPTAIAAALFCSRTSVYRAVGAYRRGHLDLGFAAGAVAAAPRVPRAGLKRSLLALLRRAPRAFGWCRVRWSCACLAAELKARRGVSLSQETVRRWLHEAGYVWKRARHAAKDDDPERARKLARIRHLVETVPRQAALFFADELDIHLLPKLGCEWMLRGTQAEVMTPGTNRKHYLAGALNFATGKLLSVVGKTGSFTEPKVYAVQTGTKVILRCVAMATDTGDLIFDPTCGSGTTAICAERLGRRWITCDTSRVAINVARQRLLGATFEHYKTRNGKVSGNFEYKTVDRVTLKSLAYDLEPEKIDLVDRPVPDNEAIRVCGPFEVMSIGRYSLEDWKGYVASDSLAGIGEPAKLENYIEVVCRLYRKGAAIQGATGLVHSVAETEKEKIAISVGPLSGRVTAKQINDAVQDALASGILEVHVLGWAFEANVGEVKSKLEGRGRVKVELIMIRPDTLAEGLKATQPEMLFSPLALPDIGVKIEMGGEAAEAVVTLNGVALFDRKHRRTEYKQADSGYISAWYLDEDYDGDCFVDCQMFFDFKKAPNLKAALKADVDPEEYKLQLVSQPFPVRGYKRIAVKVVDVYGNESTIVRQLGE